MFYVKFHTKRKTGEGSTIHGFGLIKKTSLVDSEFFGTGQGLRVPKRMNFRKICKRPLTPPLIFGKFSCKFISNFMLKKPVERFKICNIHFWIENDPPPALPLWKFSENSSVCKRKVNVVIAFLFSCNTAANKDQLKFKQRRISEHTNTQL